MRGRSSGLMSRHIFLTLSLLLAFPLTTFAQKGVVDVNGQPTYQGREIAQTMHYAGAPWLIRESRQREEDCEKMLKNLGLKPGMTVCDMGCGNGFYSLKMAEMVGKEGKVLAVDIQPEMLRLLKARAEEEGIDNIELVLGDIDNPKLPEGKVDLILCVDVYHEFSHPVEMLGHMRKSLKPDGVIALLEFRLEDPNVPIKLLHKMSKKQMNLEYESNGFEVVRQFDGLPWQHMVFYGKADKAAKPD
ncbi:class I SAM-dependent methyltransferase [Bremerella cremea]